MSVDLEGAMQIALEEGNLARGTSSPNPPVGAVVIDPDGEVIGRGHTQQPGGAHAEVMALADAGAAARHATVVCTLEPCAHTGRTGPCAEAIIRAEVARVVYAVADPDPEAAGGAAVLREAGVEVIDGLLQTEARQGALKPWLFAQDNERPFVTWKIGQSLDGQIAAEDGSSQWVTSPDARAEVHEMRAHIDAIIVGAGTVRNDNPRLTARDADGKDLPRQPLRVVVSNSGRLMPDAAIFDGTAPTLLGVGPATSHQHVDGLRADGIDTVVSGTSVSEGIDLHALLQTLFERGVLHAVVEGGPTLAGTFVSSGLVDEIITYIAPKLLLSGMWPALRGYGVSSIDDAVELDVLDVRRVGNDIRITAKPIPI